MDLKEFRIHHSTLIEHYQFIEAHLEGIYATVSGKPFLDGIKEVEKGSLSSVIREIMEIERRQDLTIFTEEDYAQLRELTERRNFWCHCCYFDLTFDRKTGGPAKVRDVQQLFDDLRDAESWRDRLFRKKIDLIRSNPKP